MEVKVHLQESLFDTPNPEIEANVKERERLRCATTYLGSKTRIQRQISRRQEESMRGLHKSGINKHLAETNWVSTVANKPHATCYIFLFVFIVLVGVYTLRLDLFATETTVNRELVSKTLEFPLNCSSGNLTRVCPVNYYPQDFQSTKPELQSFQCPHYFGWIHEDLKPWKKTRITREMVERANRTANFRLVILSGRAYVETYEKAFQTRDNFTLWGILQLLRRYPGRLPDLDLMFDCVDWPVVRSESYSRQGAPTPPPLFRYCGDEQTLDIVFPDWSFWGWAEIRIKPWEQLQRELSKGNKKIAWIDREPYVFWKGNAGVAEKRKDLLKCNLSNNMDWNVRLFPQDWAKEAQQGFKESDLSNQCIYRYKIYIEGSAWSVSEKYILACDSVSLVVKPQYYDFFSRSLMPVQHYWPIRDEDKCRSIKFAVDWGNTHKKKAQEIGKEASSFVQEDLRMELVYDYMFHLLSEYGKLLRYKPTVPEKASELCSESMACPAQGSEKTFMLESLVKAPSESGPCTMPPPFDPFTLKSFLNKKENSAKQVELWEKKYWDGQSKQA